MKGIIILNSSQYEPPFPIPPKATKRRVQRALRTLAEVGGFDAAVVDGVPGPAGSVREFMAAARAHAEAAAAELREREDTP